MGDEVASWLYEEVRDILDDIPAVSSKLLVKYISADAVGSSSEFAGYAMGFCGMTTAILAEKVSTDPLARYSSRCSAMRVRVLLSYEIQQVFVDSVLLASLLVASTSTNDDRMAAIQLVQVVVRHEELRGKVRLEMQSLVERIATEAAISLPTGRKTIKSLTSAADLVMHELRKRIDVRPYFTYDW